MRHTTLSEYATHTIPEDFTYFSNIYSCQLYGLKPIFQRVENSPLLVQSCCQWPQRWLQTNCKRKEKFKFNHSVLLCFIELRDVTRRLWKFL